MCSGELKNPRSIVTLGSCCPIVNIITVNGIVDLLGVGASQAEHTKGVKGALRVGRHLLELKNAQLGTGMQLDVRIAKSRAAILSLRARLLV